MKPSRVQIVERTRLNASAQPTATDRPTDILILFFDADGEIYSKDAIDRTDAADLDRFKRFRQRLCTAIDEGKAKMTPLFYAELGYEIELL